VTPTYQLISTGGYDHARMYTMQVTLPNGFVAVGTAPTKKTAKHNAARGMLDILEGRASNVSSEVSQSISDGLKALRGNSSTPKKSFGPKTFSPQLVVNENQMRFLQNQKKHHEELLKQQLQYGPLGVKLWFSGPNSDSREAAIEKVPNRAPPEAVGPTDDERLEKIQEGEFFIKEPMHEESIDKYMKRLILDSVFSAIDHKPSTQDIDILLKNTKSDPSGGALPESICKMCNLVFKDQSSCEEHKTTADHMHVVKGYFPGEGGYHCFLCWISFQQAEGLLNHISRANHQARCKKKGVSRIWMEPATNKSWDLLNVHKHIKDLRAEGKHSLKRSHICERRDRKSDQRRSKDDYSHRGDIRSNRKRSSPDVWRHDKFKDSDRERRHSSGSRDRKDDSKSDRGKSKSENLSSKRQREFRCRDSSSSNKDHSVEKEGKRTKSRHKSKDRFAISGSRSSYGLGTNQECNQDTDGGSPNRKRLKCYSPVHYDKNKDKDHYSSERSSSNYLSEKKMRRMTGSDHEEVNEIQDDFEIDSVGKVENSEETLQKMKSAIIGILDEEISSLSKKINK